MDLTTPKGRSGSRMLALANREARREQGLLDHPLAAKSVEAALVDGLLLAQPHNYSDALLHDTPIGAGLPPCWPTTFTSASGPCRRDSGVPSTPLRRATCATYACGKYART